MAKKTTVWDAAGNKCEVRNVDAVEILAAGGTSEAPKEFATIGVVYTAEDAAAQAEVDEKPKRKKANGSD